MPKNKIRFRRRVIKQPTVLEVADAEDDVAERFEELVGSEDDTVFLRADANERRRLAAIIAEEEVKARQEEQEEIRRIRELRRKKLDKTDAIV